MFKIIPTEYKVEDGLHSIKHKEVVFQSNDKEQLLQQMFEQLKKDYDSHENQVARYNVKFLLENKRGKEVPESSSEENF